MKRFNLNILLILFILTIDVPGIMDASEKRFSLVIRGGVGSIGIGDMNTSITSYDGYYNWLRELYPERNVGGLLEVPGRFKDWETEVQWTAWKGLSVGIALSGPVHLYESSSDSYVYSNVNQSLYVKSGIQIAAPIRLDLHYAFPINHEISFIVNGGIGLYHASMKENNNWLARTMGDTVIVGNYEYNVAGHTTGYHCGFALEYKFNDRFSMIAEGQWRFAKIKSLRGTGTGVNNEYENEWYLVSSESTNEEGYLYYFIYTGSSYPYCELEVLSDPSSIEDQVTGLRKASLNLNGFAFRIGLKIGLF